MPKEQLIGTWNLISSELHSGEHVLYPLGKDCQGLLVLDGHGNLSAHLMNPQRRQFAGGDILGGTPEEVEEAYRGYVAFWGHYEVDESAQVMRYKVAGSLFPNWIGHPQERKYVIDGDRLTLTTTPLLIQGNQVVGVLVWQRAT